MDLVTNILIIMMTLVMANLKCCYHKQAPPGHILLDEAHCIKGWRCSTPKADFALNSPM